MAVGVGTEDPARLGYAARLFACDLALLLSASTGSACVAPPYALRWKPEQIRSSPCVCLRGSPRLRFFLTRMQTSLLRFNYAV